MALDLSELKFVVNDSDLKRASETIGELVTNVGKLDKAARAAAQTEAILARAAKDNAKANLENAKAQDVRLKTTVAADKADKANEKATIAKTKAVESHTKASKENASILQRQTDIYDFLAQGFSKGQASILASAKATGQYSKELEQVLELQKQFTSDPFDRSDTGLKRLQRTIKEVTDAQNYFNDGHNLTSKQARELSNDLDRLNAGMKQQGKSYQEITKAQAVYKQQFLEEAKVVNQANSALAVVEKQRKEVVTATNYVTQADQKMAAALNTSNAALDKAGTDSLVRYETALRKSGVSQDVATDKLAKYKVQLAQVQEQEMKRREQHLTRAISPQLMDIGVSLYSGQNPMTVLIQQSGQLVDLFQLSGVEASKLGEAMRKSFYSMVPAIATVTKGLTNLFFGMFYDAGKGITNFIANVTGMNKVLQHTDDILYLIGGRVTWFSKILHTLGTIASVTFGTGVLAIVAGLAALAVGLKQVITENNDLAKAFALSGASIGLSHTQMIGYVKTLADSGATTGQATEALLAMAKAGNFTSSEILLVSDAAIQMQKGFGIAIEDTVKQFAKLKEKPVEALLEIAKSSGMVGPEVIKMVQELERAGKSTEAASVAMKAYADVTKQQVAQMKENYNGFALFMIDLGQKIKQFFSDTFKTLFLATDPNQQLQDQLVKLRERIKEVSGNLQSLGSFGDPKLLNQLKEQERVLISQIGANVRIRGEEERRKYLNAENAKYESAIAGLRGNALDAIEKETRKTQTLAEFRKSFINDKLKEAAKEKSVDIEKLKLNTDLMNVLQQQADIEYKKTQKSGSKSENYYAILMREATNNTIAANTAAQELTKSEQKLLEVRSDPRFEKLNAIQKQDVVAKYESAIAAEKQTALTEKLAEAEGHRLKLLGKSEGIGKQYYADMQKLEEFAKVAGWSREEIEELTRAIFMSTPAWKAYEKALEDVNSAARKFNEDSLASQAATLKENDSLDYRLSLLGKTTEEQKALSIEYNRANKLREVDIKLAKQLREIEEKIAEAKKKGLPESDYKALIDAEIQARKDAAEEQKAINREVAVQYAEDLQKEIDAIRNGITDSIVTALFEGGKAGSKKLRDVLVNTLRQKVTIVVDAVVNTLLGNVVGGLLGGGAASAAGSVAGAAGTSILGSVGSSVFGKAVTGSAGSFLGAGSFTGMLSNMWSGITTGFSTLFTKGIGAWFSQGTGLMSAGAVGGGLGALAGPISAVLLLATNWKKLFGRTLKDSGIQGEFGGETGFEGQQYKFYKGGLFRSDKTKLSPLDEATRKTFADSFIAMKKQIVDFANVLGLSADKLEGFSSGIKLSLKGLSEEEAIKKIQEAIATVNNEMAQEILGSWTEVTNEVTRTVAAVGSFWDNAVLETITAQETTRTYAPSEFAREGEKAIDTLTRLATSLSTVNQVFDTLGVKLYDASLAGGNLASKLIDLFGNIDEFVKSTTFYYQNFYTEAERQQTALRQLTAEFSKHNLVLPKTREEYRKLVEAQDLTTEEGRKMYAWLLQLTPAFAGITEAVGETVTEVQALAKAERARMQAARESANKLVEEQTKSFKNLQDNLSKEAFKSKGGMAYGFNVSISEVQSSEKFITALDSATASLAELEKLNLGSEFEKYASEIGKIIQGTKELFATHLANSRLAQGNVTGAMQAKMGASQLNYSDFTKNGQFNAGAFNVAYAREQATAAKGLVDVANSNALTTSNVASVIGQLNAFAQSDLILNEIKQGFIQGVREASNTTSTYVVRDAIQGLAGVFAGQQSNQQFLNTSTGLPAIAAAYSAAADMQKVQMIDGARYMGELSISYANAISNLNANFNRGKITTDELEGAVKALEESFGELKEYAVTPVQIAMSRVGASSAIAQEGIKALNLYFGQLTDRAGELAEQAKLASEPIAVVTDVIGRMTSFTDVFATSANAVINGFKGMTGAVGAMSHAIYQMETEGLILTTEQKSAMMADAAYSANMGKQGLKDALTYGSQVRKALLIAQAGSIAGDTLTTSDASKVAEKLQVDPAFAKLTAAGIRDASLLLDGLKQFDANSFEKVFVRISEALNQGALNEEQYAALFDESIKIYTDHDAKIKQVTDSFNTLRDAAKSLADQLLIDAGYTSLTGSQTLDEAQRQYNAVLLRALGGDVTAASDLSGITQQMLDIAKQQATDESTYNRLFGATISDLRTVERLQTPKAISEPIKVSAETNAELIEQIKLLREEIRASNAQIASNTDKTNKSLQEFQVNGMPTVALT